MSIEVTPKKEIGEKYPATIWKAEPVDGEWGPQVRLALIETNGNLLSLFLPIPATERNRTGRVLTSLTGTYPEGTYDEQLLVGMTVDMIYAQKRGPGASPGDLSLDLLKPRKAGKNEDPVATVNEQMARDNLEAPF